MQGLQSDTLERQLIRKVQAGDAAAFETLFKRYSPKVYRQAMHLLNNEAEAEEAMQEVFLTIYEKANTFRGDSAFSTWLYRLTANAALSRLRRRQRRPEILIDDYLQRIKGPPASATAEGSSQGSLRPRSDAEAQRPSPPGR